MATPRQLREIFAPVLAAYPDLVLHRRWLFRPPIRTAIIGLFIAPTGYASHADIALSVLPLSRIKAPSALGFERTFEVERVIGAPRPERSIPGGEEGPPRIYQDLFAPEYQVHLLQNFNAKARPFFDKIRNLDEVVEWIKPFREPPLRNSPIELIDGWIAAMRGDFTAAADQLQAFFNRMGERYLRGAPNESQQLEEDVLRTLRSGDRFVIASFLHAMEERTVTKQGLERFWQRTPFPFEQS